MYHKEHPITLTPEIVRGALSIYLGAQAKEDVKSMLFGLSLMKGATSEMIDDAILLQSARSPWSPSQIKARLGETAFVEGAPYRGPNA